MPNHKKENHLGQAVKKVFKTKTKMCAAIWYRLTIQTTKSNKQS